MAPSRPKGNGDAPPSAGTYLNDAETQLNAGNIDEAISLADQALGATGQGGDFELRALNLLGVLHIESGDIEEAREYFLRSVKLDEDGTVDEKIGGGPEKFLFLAQLSEDGGQDSVQWFDRGASALRKQIQSLADVAKKTPAQQASHDEKQQKLGEVLCAVAEVYMTDLSWEDDAEQRCETLVTEAMMIAPNSAETWQTVANVRISQERVDEARTALKRSLGMWSELEPEHPAVPEFPVRIGLARLLLEVELLDEASVVLERLISDDDESVEAWYLGGWCLYLVGEKVQDIRGKESDEWQPAWESARRWLARCLKIYEAQEYEDERLGQHADELMHNINKELGDPPPGFEDDWGEESDEEDEDEDMKD